MKRDAHALNLVELEAEFGPLTKAERRMLVLGIRGADGDVPLTTEQLLERVEHRAELSADDLNALLTELRARGAELHAGDVGDAELAQLQSIATAVGQIAEAQESLTAEETRIAAEADAALALIQGGADEPAADPAAPAADADLADADPAAPAADADPAAPAADADPAAPAADTDPAAPAQEPVAASAAPRVSRVAARRPGAVAPRAAVADERMVLRASANVPGMAAGTVLDSPEMIMRSVEQVVRASVGYKGPRVQLPMFSLGVMDASEIYGEDRTLRRDPRTNEERISALASPEAIRASGGICAPVPIQYDLPILGSDSRPARDMLARMGADRGGVRVLPPPQLSDVGGAVGIWTEGNDISLSDPTTKPCLELDCPDEVEVLVDAITRCLKIGNFRARYFPEQIEAWVKLVGVAFARTADTKIITAIGAGSTQITAGDRIMGTVREVLAVIDRATAGLRSRRRLEPTFPVHIAAPAWLYNNMVTDLSREQPGANAERLATSMAQIEAWFSARNVMVSWLLDGEAGQMFGAQADGALLEWPNQVVVYLWIEGEWIFLDGGTLDFGLVRDSTLNATNDFQLFSEGFENVVFHGNESMRLKINICPSGATSAAVDGSDLCTIGS